MDNDYILTPDGELCHWGTKGMRWGIRRYQNKDGSLTPAGRKRYSAEVANLKEREKVIARKERVKSQVAKIDAKKAELDAREAALNGGKGGKMQTKKQKGVKDMSDEELAKAVVRSRLENEYEKLNPKKESILAKFTKKTLEDVLIPSVVNAGKSYLEKRLAPTQDEPSIEDLLKKYGDMPEAQRKRYQDAAIVKSYENTILGKKNK